MALLGAKGLLNRYASLHEKFKFHSYTFISSFLNREATTTRWLSLSLAFIARIRYRGLPTNVVAMSHPYTTSPSDIFAPFYLKKVVPRQPVVSLMVTTSSKLILANTILPNWPTIKLLRNWIILNVSFHHHLLIWTQFTHSNLQQTMGTICFQHEVKHSRIAN